MIIPPITLLRVLYLVLVLADRFYELSKKCRILERKIMINIPKFPLDSDVAKNQHLIPRTYFVDS